MSRIVIVGGKLQGSEAAYLGKQAGIEIILIDKDKNAPAQKLCSQFICADVLSDTKEVADALAGADMILPTMENSEVLESLTKLAREKNYKLAFDIEAYRISSSKIISDRLFADNNIPCPGYYPQGRLPYIAKPDGESGSHGIFLLDTQEKLDAFLKEKKDKYIIQEFAEGMSYSIEIIGMPGNYRTYEPTEIFTDDIYDCNLASCYRTISADKKAVLQETAVKIAEIIGLKGIMDLEVIDRNGELLVLEIDARLPSQTPIAVYRATGMNYIKELYDLFCMGDFCDANSDKGEFASYTHYLFKNGRITSEGEHIMTVGGLLEYTEDMCSKADVISDYNEAYREEWRGIFVNWGSTLQSLKDKEALTLHEIKKLVKR